jgi:hypothetical protein
MTNQTFRIALVSQIRTAIDTFPRSINLTNRTTYSANWLNLRHIASYALAIRRIPSGAAEADIHTLVPRVEVLMILAGFEVNTLSKLDPEITAAALTAKSQIID